MRKIKSLKRKNSLLFGALLLVALFAFDPQLFNANPVQASKIAVEWGHLADGYDPNEYSWEYSFRLHR